MIFLDLSDLIHIAHRILPEVALRDGGLLESALARPAATVFGVAAYPDLHSKAAALLHSLATNHGLVDGNKRLSLAAVIAFLGINGHRLIMTNDEAYDLVLAVASRRTDDIEEIPASLRAWSIVAAA